MFIKNKLTKVPRELCKATAFLVIVGGFATIIFDLFAFLLQFGKDSIVAGNTILGLICIVLFYTKSIVSSSLNLWTEEAKNHQKEMREMIINSRTAEILTKTRNKVFVSDNQTMPSSRVLSSVHSYINRLWEFKFCLPSDIINLVSVILMLVGFVMVTTVEIENVALFVIVICLISIATMCFSFIRGKYWDRHRKENKALQEKEDLVRNDLLNLEPQDERHSNFMIFTYIDAMKKSFDFNKKDWHDINKLGLVESIVNTLATIFIICIKIFEVGIDNVTLETVLSIIALQTIYSQIMGKIYGIVRTYERYREMIKAMESYLPDVKNVFDVYEKEENMKLSDDSTFKIPVFEVEYKTGERNYRLINQSETVFNTGDCVLLTGPTGCGKSTFMKMLTGKIRLGEVFKSNFISVMHYSDTRLGCQDVLSEVVFGQEYDEEKLIAILKGLHLYEEISLKSSDVIEYLRNTTAENYSTGQKQRLLIARMLYNLEDNVKIVAFDEATNALNDAIAYQVMAYIREYCKDKLLLVASHQVEICEKFATKHFEFVADDSAYILKQK